MIGTESGYVHTNCTPICTISGHAIARDGSDILQQIRDFLLAGSLSDCLIQGSK
jgi:hypothetical protein